MNRSPRELSRLAMELSRMFPALYGRGPAGAAGSIGATGAKGDKGDKGDTGAQGPAGEAPSNVPTVVASFAAKGMEADISSTPLLSSAPVGLYRVSAQMVWSNVTPAGTITVTISDSGSSTQAQSYFDNSDPSGPQTVKAIITHGTPGDILIATSGYTQDSPGTDVYDVYVVLELLPDATDEAALYYLNAAADTSVDAGATVTLDPTGPTFAAGTEVEVTPVPSEGYAFAGWTGDVPSGHEADNPLTLTMTSAVSINATFAEE